MVSPSAARAAVRALLTDTSFTNPEIGEEALDACIQDAVLEFSGERPPMLTVDVDGTGSPYILLSEIEGWVQGFSSVVSLEYPAGEPGPSYTPTMLSLPHDMTWYDGPSGRYLRLTTVSPAEGETLRVTFTVPHQLTTEVNTVYQVDLPAVYALSVANACQVMANQAAASTSDTMGDGTNYRDAQLRWSSQAKDWRKRYQGLIGSEDGGPPAGRAFTWLTRPGGPAGNRRWYSHDRRPLAG